jgi:hypothetical protein
MAKLDPPENREAEYNKWYQNTHIAQRLAIPGFLYARRFKIIEGAPKGLFVPGEANHLTLYDLADTRVLKEEQYRQLSQKEASLPPDSFEVITPKLPKFARGVYEQIYPTQGEYTPPATKFVFLIGHEVPRNRQQEFNAWYNTEHIPTIMQVPGFVTARRFILAEREFPQWLGPGGSLPKYLTLYDIESEHIFETEEFKKAHVSPWSAWVRSWFTRKMLAIYSLISLEE